MQETIIRLIIYRDNENKLRLFREACPVMRWTDEGPVVRHLAWAIKGKPGKNCQTTTLNASYYLNRHLNPDHTNLSPSSWYTQDQEDVGRKLLMNSAIKDIEHEIQSLQADICTIRAMDDGTVKPDEKPISPSRSSHGDGPGF